MIPRALSAPVRAAAGMYPVITITGPRQSGKTTLCRALFPHLPYYSFEAPDIRLMAQDDPRGLLAQCPGGAVLDEIQRVPDLASYLQELVDAPAFKGLFVLTGSQNLALLQTVSQSLAGRSAVFTLAPFSMAELRDAGVATGSVDEWIFRGFYPRIYDRHVPPSRFYSDYIATYLERDLRALRAVHDLTQFQRFVGLCAGRVGAPINMESLGNEAGVSQRSARLWLELLEASYLVFRLPPWFRNVNKRLVKTPKIFFYDTGLVAHLLGISAHEQLVNHPLRGALFENLMVAEALKQRLNQGGRHDLMFYRDSHGHEVDLVIPSAQGCQAIEIKSAATFQRDFLKGLDQFARVFSENTRRMLVYTGAQQLRTHDTDIVPFEQMTGMLPPASPPDANPTTPGLLH